MFFRIIKAIEKTDISCDSGVRKRMMEQALVSHMHGGDIYRNKINIDFSVNANPLGPQKEVLDAICDAAGDISHYPDIYCEKLVYSISQFEQVPEESVICSNGAAELFFSVVLAVKPRKALLFSPTFSEYERALGTIDTDIIYYELKRKNDFQIQEDIVDYITPDLDMIFVCNPNNPTGQAVSKELLERIAGKCQECGAILVIDECFIDFLDSPEEYEIKSELNHYPNILIVKAFTKLFCMPGLRLGYAVSSNKELLNKMRLTMQPWNVSALAQAGGIAALENCRSYVEKTKRVIKKEREFLMQELNKLGYKVYGSKANYVFFEAAEGREEKSLYEKALSAGFLIRDCSNYRGLCKGYYRIAVRTRQENERIITWLRGL